MRFDPLNRKSEAIFRGRGGLMRYRTSISYNSSKGVNKGLWQKYGDDCVISASIIKYTEYEVILRPRPLKT